MFYHEILFFHSVFNLIISSITSLIICSTFCLFINLLIRLFNNFVLTIDYSVIDWFVICYFFIHFFFLTSVYFFVDPVTYISLLIRWLILEKLLVSLHTLQLHVCCSLCWRVAPVTALRPLLFHSGGVGRGL